MFNSLREYKEKRNLTVNQLAEKLQCSIRQTIRFLNGKPMSPILALWTEHFLGIEKEKLVFTQELLQEVMYD